MATSLSPAQQQRARALYRTLLKTTAQVFQNDLPAKAAAHAETRRQFLQARQEADSVKIDQALDMGDQIAHLFKHNVVQGVAEEDPYTFHLRFTEHTELGSNETIKQPRRAPGLDEIQRMHTQKQRHPGTHTSTRTFATSATRPDKHNEALPRPIPRFPGIVILADGSAVQLTTTSPRHLSKLARDYTNHPLWNQTAGERSDADAEDDTGRLGRFRRRFAEEAAQGAAPAGVAFDEGDLDWMTGGREARQGSPLAAKKAKGKSRK
ncbi:hypothetical protein MVES1_003875 [Malassezia vespertilionis]|uniref:Mitochondrial zinc maintenance protein 1, mitochondrial n=1 Tax=Malassezia vespertilionis TaxID=2020962 RepID=A0A2N1J7N3_9BASI|nr:uncharacterized protein MVES1_003875 [Malassezia vespertilionis]PKI82568.1 hypothetical protein MVES_003432 [Malassezia vespertilionis]WFD08499.1 hypothetical protein MVES1_003875 [Malassezia vespertilionis]